MDRDWMNEPKFWMLNQKQWQKIFLAVLISILALALRVNLAVNGPVEYDEPVYVDAALLYANGVRSGTPGIILSSDYNIEHPPLNKLAYAAVLGTPPEGGISMPFDTAITELPGFRKLLNMRLVSVFFGCLAVFVLSLINPWAGLFLAIHTFAVKYTSIIYLEALPLFLSLLSVFMFYRHLSAKTRNTFMEKNWWIISAIAFGTAVASKYLYAVAGAAIVIYYGCLLLSKKEKDWKFLFAWGGIAILVFFIADPVLWSNPIQGLSRSIGFHFNYSSDDAVVNIKNYPVYQPLFWLLLSIPQHDLHLMPFFVHVNNFWITLDSLILIPALAGVWRLFKKYPLYFIWLVLSLIALLTWKVKWPQYIMLIIVPYCLSAGVGIEWIMQQCQKLGNTLWNKIAC